MKYKILVTCPPMLKQISYFKDKFLEMGFDVTTPDVVQTLSVKELLDIVPEHDGWIIGDDPATREVFEAGKLGKLQAAVKWGIGTDNVDFDACKDLNIPIINTPGMFGEEVADLAMCYILGLARDAFFIDREVRKGHWPKPTGISLQEKTLGIIGLGDIGKNIAKRANAHGLKVLGWDPNINSLPDYIELKSKWPLGIEECDFLVFACALNDSTYHLLSKSILIHLKPGVKVVNISRGRLIDENALLDGLASGIISSAALDVFEEEPLSKSHKIINYPNCILGSHNGSNTTEAVLRASTESISILENMLSKKNNSF